MNPGGATCRLSTNRMSISCKAHWGDGASSSVAKTAGLLELLERLGSPGSKVVAGRSRQTSRVKRLGDGPPDYELCR